MNKTFSIKKLLLSIFLLVIYTDLVFGKEIKTFKVDYVKQGDNLKVKVTTDLPDNTSLFIECVKAGLRDNDSWIGRQTRGTVNNGVAEANLDISGLPKGKYELEVLFNSFWSSRLGTREPQIVSVIGEYGENIKTPYISTFYDGNSGKKYRMIQFKKVAFSITNADAKRYDDARKKEAEEYEKKQQARENFEREKRKIYSEENIKLALISYAKSMSGRLWSFKIITVDKINKINDTTCEAKGVIERLSFDYSEKDKLGLPKTVTDRAKFESTVRLGSDGWTVEKLEPTQGLFRTKKSFVD